MTSFAIEVEPPLPAAPQPIPKLSVESITPRIEFYDQRFQYDVRFRVGGRLFCYYPSDILTVYYDLLHEWELIKTREPHDISLAGYPLLEMQFNNDMAYFYDVVSRSEDPTSGPLGGEYNAKVIEDIFESAAASAWLRLKQIAEECDRVC